MLIFIFVVSFAEVIKVDVEFTNPLQIPISVSGVSLICEHSGRSDGTNSGMLQ